MEGQLTKASEVNNDVSAALVTICGIEATDSVEQTPVK